MTTHTVTVPIKTIIDYWYKDYKFEDNKKPLIWDWYFDSVKGKVLFDFKFKDALVGVNEP